MFNEIEGLPDDWRAGDRGTCGAVIGCLRALGCGIGESGIGEQGIGEQGIGEPVVQLSGASWRLDWNSGGMI